MQIDFHHAVTYILARWAGFTHQEAETVAYAAQYVDDAKNNGVLTFSTGEMFNRTASAHEVYDIHALLDRYEDSLSWVPFHFLPGNCEGTSSSPETKNIADRLVCVANSAIAREMVAECIRQKGSPYGSLHRLGVTMHVYADTWAHACFAGIKHPVNTVSKLNAPESAKKLPYKVIPNLGHGEALCCPDMPSLEWSFTKGNGFSESRHNPTRFVDAANNMTIAMQRYRTGSSEAPVSGLTTDQKGFLLNSFTVIDDIEEKTRHGRWLKIINSGELDGMGAVTLGYDAHGQNSWKCAATGLTGEKDDASTHPEYSPAFLTSDWKLFHDAVEYHRTYILNVLLPKYGICAA